MEEAEDENEEKRIEEEDNEGYQEEGSQHGLLNSIV